MLLVSNLSVFYLLLHIGLIFVLLVSNLSVFLSVAAYRMNSALLSRFDLVSGGVRE